MQTFFIIVVLQNAEIFNSLLGFVFDLYCKHDLLICYRFVFGESHRCAFSNFLSYSAITNIINSLLMRHSSLPLVGIGRFYLFLRRIHSYRSCLLETLCCFPSIFFSHSLAHLVRKHGFCASPEQRNRYSLLAGRLHDVIVIYSPIVLL